jgi:hypothetical protein
VESVPLAMVMRIEPARHEERNLAGFVLECKDFRAVSMFFLRPEPVKTLTNLFKQHLFPQQITYAITTVLIFSCACSDACASECVIA